MMGAVIGVKGYRNSTVEAINGIGGPILGTIGAMAVFGMATLFGVNTPWGSLFVRLAYLGFFINFFNLIPVTFGGGFTLDGGRILQAVSKWFSVVGVLMMGALVFFDVFHSAFIWIFLILGIWGTFKRFQKPDDPAYHTTSPSGKAVIGLAYLSLLVFLVASMASTEGYFMGGSL
jgi:Zn-dependent protease